MREFTWKDAVKFQRRWLLHPVTAFRIWQHFRRLDRLDAARVEMYRGLQTGDTLRALRSARRAARLARLTKQPLEQLRFDRWERAIRSGRKIRFATFPAKFRFPGDPSFETIDEIDAIYEQGERS